MLRESGQDEAGLSARHLRASSPPCYRAPKDSCASIRIDLLDLLVKVSKEACRARKATNDSVPCGFGYSN